MSRCAWGVTIVVLAFVAMASPARPQVARPRPDSADVRKRILKAIRDTSGETALDRYRLPYLAAEAGLNIPALVGPFLRSPNATVRAHAIEFLDPDLLADSKLAQVDSAITLLQLSMRDDSPEVREAAVQHLARCEVFRKGSAAPALTAALADRDGEVRRGAVYALGQMDSAAIPAIPKIIQLMSRDPSRDVQWLSIRVLGWLGPLARQATPALTQLTGSPNDSIRVEAVLSLGSVARPRHGQAVDTQIVATLRKAMGDRSPEVRQAAVQGLAWLGPHGAELAASALTDPDTSVAMTAAGLLGQGEASPPVIVALIHALSNPRAQLRLEAADALGSLGEATRHDLTAAAASPDPAVREGARRGLRYLDRVRASAVFDRCYTISRGPWSPVLDLGGDSVFSIPTRTIRFLGRKADWTRDPDSPVEMLAIPANGSRMTIHGTPSWMPSSDGHGIEIVWSTGFSGLTMRLQTADSGATLTGQAETFWDFPREVQRAPVQAKRVECQELDTAR